MLALEALTRNFQVQQAEETDTETKAQRGGGLRFVDQCGVIEHELLKRITEHRIVRAVQWVQAGEHHGFGVVVAGQRRGGRLVERGDGVAHLGQAHVLDTRDQVAHFADAEALGRLGFRGAHTNFQQFMGGAGGHHLNLLARTQAAVNDTDVGDHAAVGVVDGIEDHGAGGSVRIAHGGGQLAHDQVQQLFNTDACLARNHQHVFGLAADEVGKFGSILFRLRGRQVNLVQHRNDGEVVLHGQIQVGQRLGFNALGCINEQDGTFTGCQGPGYLVGEVHVARGVDHVQAIRRPVHFPGNTDCLGLDGDAAFALDVHAVKVLRLHVTLLNHSCELEHPVGQGGLAVVDVGDDAEVPDDRRIGRGGHRGSAGHG